VAAASSEWFAFSLLISWICRLPNSVPTSLPRCRRQPIGDPGHQEHRKRDRHRNPILRNYTTTNHVNCQKRDDAKCPIDDVSNRRSVRVDTPRPGNLDRTRVSRHHWKLTQRRQAGPMVFWCQSCHAPALAWSPMVSAHKLSKDPDTYSEPPPSGTRCRGQCHGWKSRETRQRTRNSSLIVPPETINPTAIQNAPGACWSKRYPIPQSNATLAALSRK
jgi:hypothetical protein